MAQYEDMSEALDVIKTLNHPVRLSILCHLIEKEKMSAGDIVEQEKERASQSQVSQYLKWLRDKGYVETRKDGKHVFYKINSPEIKTLIGTMHDLFCSHDDDFCS